MEPNSYWSLEWKEAIGEPLEDFWKHLLYLNSKRIRYKLDEVKNAYSLAIAQNIKAIDSLAWWLKKIIISNDVLFDDSSTWNWKEKGVDE